MANPLRILFMGSPAAAVPCLNFLHASEHALVGVVTQPDRPLGRGRQLTACPVAARAVDLGLKVYQPEKLTKPPFITTMEGLQIDLAIVVAYGKILRTDILEAPRHGCWNVHFSLLPKYRGAAPCQWAIVNGEVETGISIIHLVEALDAGPILKQIRAPIDPDESSGQLLDRLAQLAPPLLATALSELLVGQLQEQVQDDTAASLAPLLKKEDGRLDWSQSARQLKDRIRGLNPWPGAYTEFVATSGSVDKIRLKIYSAQAEAQSALVTGGVAPGTIIRADGKTGLWVACGDGVLQIDELQASGKKRMKATDFLSGFTLKETTQLI